MRVQRDFIGAAAVHCEWSVWNRERRITNYAPWGIKWYDGTVYPFKEIESYKPRSRALGNDRAFLQSMGMAYNWMYRAGELLGHFVLHTRLINHKDIFHLEGNILCGIE